MGAKRGSSAIISHEVSWRGKRTGSLIGPTAMSFSESSEKFVFLFLFPVYGVTGGDGRAISDCVRLRSADIGGSFISWLIDESCESSYDDNGGLKFSNGFDSGGDMRLETDGICFILTLSLRSTSGEVEGEVIVR